MLELCHYQAKWQNGMRFDEADLLHFHPSYTFKRKSAMDTRWCVAPHGVAPHGHRCLLASFLWVLQSCCEIAQDPTSGNVRDTIKKSRTGENYQRRNYHEVRNKFTIQHSWSPLHNLFWNTHFRLPLSCSSSVLTSSIVVVENIIVPALEVFLSNDHEIMLCVLEQLRVLWSPSLEWACVNLKAEIHKCQEVCGISPLRRGSQNSRLLAYNPPQVRSCIVLVCERSSRQSGWRCVMGSAISQGAYLGGADAFVTDSTTCREVQWNGF